MELSKLPSVNAALNAMSAFFLVLGYIFIRQRAIKAHTMCMVSAFGTSTLFLISYIYYHLHHGRTPFQGEGFIRSLYFGILFSHTVLALVIVPLAIITLSRGLRGRFYQHVQIARVTLPIWLYVSVTGVLVYLMLYHLHAA